MKAIILFSMLLMVNLIQAQGRKQKQADEDTDHWRYEIECMGTGVQGSYLIKVWTYSVRPTIAIEQAKKNAVHGIIFKGYSTGQQRCTAQKPLARDPDVEELHAKFFDEFFAEGGKYMKYVNLTTDGAIAAGDMLKIGKKEYKIGVVVSVSKDELRRYLVSEGIIKGLLDGF